MPAGLSHGHDGGARGRCTRYQKKRGYDVDTDSVSLVKTLPAGRHGTAYPEMTWEPEESASEEITQVAWQHRHST